MNAGEEKDADIERVMAALETLGEHFDHVHIFTQRDSGDHNTATVSLGSGGWYARYGQIREWLVKEEYRMRCEVDAQAEDE